MDKKKPNRTGFLFPVMDFITGMGSILNIAGNNIELGYDKNDPFADSKAINSDWAAVCQDLNSACHERNKGN